MKTVQFNPVAMIYSALSYCSSSDSISISTLSSQSSGYDRYKNAAFGDNGYITQTLYQKKMFHNNETDNLLRPETVFLKKEPKKSPRQLRLEKKHYLLKDQWCPSLRKKTKTQNVEYRYPQYMDAKEINELLFAQPSIGAFSGSDHSSLYSDYSLLEPSGNIFSDISALKRYSDFTASDKMTRYSFDTSLTSESDINQPQLDSSITEEIESFLSESKSNSGIYNGIEAGR